MRIDERGAHEPGHDAVVDRVAAEAGADLPLLDDLERNRQRAGLERQGQVLRLLEALVAERDLPVAADPALDHRRTPLDPAVEQDRHVVADVLARLVAELAAAGPVELERDDRSVGERVELRRGVFEVAAGDDRPVVEDVEEADRLARRRWWATRTTGG